MSKQRQLIILALIVFYGLMLRAQNFTKSRSWQDERDASHYATSQSGWESMKDWGQPPLHYVTMHWLDSIPNYTGLTNDKLFRWYSVVASTLAIIPAFYLGRLVLGKPLYGLLVAFISASMQLQIYYGQEIRMYALLTLFASISWLAYFTARQNKNHLTFLAVANSLAIMTHTLAVVMILYQAFVWLISGLKRILCGNRSRANLQRLAAEIGFICLPLVVFVLMYGSTLANYQASIVKPHWDIREIITPIPAHTGFWAQVRLLRHLSGIEVGKIEFVLVAIMTVLAAIKTKRSRLPLIFGSYIFSMLLVQYSLATGRLHLFATRYLIYLTPVFSLLILETVSELVKTDNRKRLAPAEALMLLGIIAIYAKQTLQYVLSNPIHYASMP